MEENFQKYDKINTTAVTWIKYQGLKHNKIGLSNFNPKRKDHLWLLHMFKSYSYLSGYCDYYVKTDLWSYLKLKRNKDFKHLKRYIIQPDIYFIDCLVFIQEINSIYNDQDIFNKIYDAYFNKDGD